MSAARIGRVRMKASNVVPLRTITKLDLSPDVILIAAIGKLKEVVIIGFDDDGDEYFASSKSDGGDVLWHVARVSHRLMVMTDERISGAA